MKSLRERLGRLSPTEVADPAADLNSWGEWIWPKGMATAVTTGTSADVTRKWNTLSTLGVGPVADVDAGGCISLRHRPLSIDVWIGGGDRWWFPSREPTVRQTRIEGLPVLETRMKVGDADVVFTTWADESGDARGRVMLQLSTELEVPVVAAIVVRPLTLLGRGSVQDLRLSGDLIVADKRPVVQLPREAGDSAVGSTELGDVHLRLGDELIGEASVHAADGTATLAAMIPLAPGVDQLVQIIDGTDEATVAPADVHQIVSGWKSHLNRGASIALPGWPKHIPASLVSGLLGSVAGSRAVPGDDRSLADDTLLCVALAQGGFSWAAATVLDALLEAVTEGRIDRGDWLLVAGACAAVAALGDEYQVFENHTDTVALIMGEGLAAGGLDKRDAVAAVRLAAGERAADDATQIEPGVPTEQQVLQLGRLGVLRDDAEHRPVHEAAASFSGLRDASALSLAMISGARGGEPFDAVIATRSLAGTTWRWASTTDGPGLDRGSGDSPHARASLFLGLRAQAIRETAYGIDLLPGFSESWLGRNLDVSGLPTRHGTLSFALRWHGPRSALLWELTPNDGGTAPEISARSIDPSFSTVELSGETLLQEPQMGSDSGSS
jgi:hypothetical protein